MALVIIKHESPYPGDRWTLTKAAATVFIKGQPVSFESNAAVHMDLVSEDASFVGIAAEAAGTDRTEVTVLKKCIVEITATSATYALGAGIKYSSGGATTDYVMVADGGANTLGFVHKDYSSAATRILVEFDVDRLEKLDATEA